MQNVRILLIDDHQMFREALRGLLERLSNYEIVGESGNALDVLELIEKTKPNVVCIDISMPEINGVEATRKIIEAYPDVKVIALSTYSEQRYVMDMMNAGASGYVTKAGASEELLRAIDAVMNKRHYLCPDATAAVMGAMNQKTSVANTPRLGKREAQVLQLVAQGLTSVTIAEKLFIAPATVEVHRRNIMRKLNLHNIAELTRYAINNNL